MVAKLFTDTSQMLVEDVRKVAIHNSLVTETTRHRVRMVINDGAMLVYSSDIISVIDQLHTGGFYTEEEHEIVSEKAKSMLAQEAMVYGKSDR